MRWGWGGGGGGGEQGVVVKNKVQDGGAPFTLHHRPDEGEEDDECDALRAKHFERSMKHSGGVGAGRGVGRGGSRN